MAETSSQRNLGRVVFLAAILLGLGFVAGYGFQSRQRVEVMPTPTPQPTKTDDETAPSLAPVVKGLRVRPNDRLLAFAGIYDGSQRAGRFVFDLQTRRMSVEETPVGWQDYVVQWSDDGGKILFEREKIPRPVAEASGGLYQETIRAAPLASAKSSPLPNAENAQTRREEPLGLAGGAAPPGEKIIAGQWGPGGLIIKTRREPKALYLMRDQNAVPLDQAGLTYYQNRAILENGNLALYVIRNLPGSREKFGLFRVQNNKAKPLSPVFENVSWAYIAENARWMIVCHPSQNGNNWRWELYSIAPNAAKLVKTAQVPSDVIVVYWSPDFKHVLGSSGDKLWLIDIPTLKTKQLGTRADWRADDAAWLNREQAVVVAAGGILWKVRVPEGTATQLWRFPAGYWK